LILCVVTYSVLKKWLPEEGSSMVADIVFLLLPVLAYAKWKTSSVLSSLRLQTVSPGILLRTVFLAITGMGIASFVQGLMRPIADNYFGDLTLFMETTMQSLAPRTPAALLRTLCSVGIVEPICFQLLIRGAFQGTLEKRGQVRAILISSLIFGLLSCNPATFVDTTLLAIALGVVVWRTGSIIPAILCQMISNSLASLRLYFVGSTYKNPMWVDVGLIILFAALLWELVLHTRSAERKPSMLASAPALAGKRFLGVLLAAGMACGLFFAGVLSCFGVAEMSHNLLAPSYCLGDFMFYKRGWAFRSQELKTADVIVYSVGPGVIGLSRIVGVSGDSLTLYTPPREDAAPGEVIDRKSVLGNVVWKWTPGPEFRQQMVQMRKNQSIRGKEPVKP
jgi:membrane protease YdiL (CAAX protease family)